MRKSVLALAAASGVFAPTATDDAGVAASTSCKASATWAFADGDAVNGAWDNDANTWTFQYTATAPTSPIASVGVNYTLISNAAAVTGNRTIGGPPATDSAGLTVDITALAYDSTNTAVAGRSEHWSSSFPWLVTHSWGDYYFADPAWFNADPSQSGYTLMSEGFWQVGDVGNGSRIYNATGDGPLVPYIPFTP